MAEAHRTSSVRRVASPSIRGLLVAAGLGAVLLGLLWALVPDSATALDRRAFALLSATPGSPLVPAARLLAQVGPPCAAVGVLGLLWALAVRRRWRGVAVILGGCPLTVVADRVAKALDERPRPTGRLLVATGYSFPSAEAALSIGLVAIALALAGIAGPRTGRAALAAAALLILSLGALLISVRVHYLTDVLAGWALGTIVFALFGAVVLALDRRPCARAAPATQPRSGSRLS